jgi:hypothetical protein
LLRAVSHQRYAHHVSSGLILVLVILPCAVMWVVALAQSKGRERVSGPFLLLPVVAVLLAFALFGFVRPHEDRSETGEEMTGPGDRARGQTEPPAVDCWLGTAVEVP